MHLNLLTARLWTDHDARLGLKLVLCLTTWLSARSRRLYRPVNGSTQWYNLIGRECERCNVARRLRRDMTEQLARISQRGAKPTQVQAKLVCVTLHVVSISAAHRRVGCSLRLQRRYHMCDRCRRVRQHSADLSQQ